METHITAFSTLIPNSFSFCWSISETADPMEVDEPPVEQFSGTVSAARIETFERVFGQHMRTHRLDDISIADIVTVVNNNGVGASRFSADEIMALLEVIHKLRDKLSHSLTFYTISS